MKRRGWAGLGLLLAAVALGGMGLQRWQRGDAPLIGQPSGDGGAVILGSLLSQALPRAVSSTAHEARPDVPSVATERDVVIPPEGVEICGVRRVSAEELRRWKADRSLGEAQAKLIDEKMQQLGQAGVERISARLAAGNAHQQVAARLLMMDVDGAALLAERSSDALAYQLALTACRRDRAAAPHCSGLSAQRWAALDPADARPWLQVLNDAYHRKDTAGVDAALAEAAARPRLSRGSHLLEAQAVAAADALLAAAAAVALAVWISVGTGSEAEHDSERPAAAVSSTNSVDETEMLGLPATPMPGLPRAWTGRSSASSVDERASLAQRMKADWCGFGAEEHARQTDAVFEKARAVSGVIGSEALEEIKRTVGAEVLREARQRAVQRWSTVLNQRGDARSRAVAEMLLSEYTAGNAAVQARARLQAIARSSHDPMVTALALHYRCAPGACQNVDATQWSRLEPANVQAWMAVLDNATGAQQTQTIYVMDRIATQASYWRGYDRELFELLSTLPQTAVTGLDGEAEISILQRFSFMLIPSLRPVVEACRSGLAEPAMPARCEAVASRLWQDGDFMSRLLSMAVTRNSLQLQPALRPLWEERAHELDAMRQWSQQEQTRALKLLMPEGAEAAACDLQPGIRQMLSDQFAWNSWKEARAAMRAATADEAALAAEWRRRTGRSSLDPPTAPASAAPR